MNDKIEINKKMIGKQVRVVADFFEWAGEVVDVKDSETLLVANGSELVAVNIFDVRSIN
jgi:hypothetical protein